MTMRRSVGTFALAVATVALTGCIPKMTIEEMKSGMPKRPPELDKLNMFVGTWEGTGEVEFAMLDQPLKTTSKSTTEWGCDGWCVIERGTFEMEEFDPMDGIGVWTYDLKGKKYRGFWVDSMGMTSTATATWCDKTKTWKMKGKGHDPWGRNIWKGTVTLTDPNTMEWEMTQWDGSGLMKVMEMTGIAHKK